jgi:hypothetical protein
MIASIDHAALRDVLGLLAQLEILMSLQRTWDLPITK